MTTLLVLAVYIGVALFMAFPVIYRAIRYAMSGNHWCAVDRGFCSVLSLLLSCIWPVIVPLALLFAIVYGRAVKIDAEFEIRRVEETRKRAS